MKITTKEIKEYFRVSMRYYDAKHDSYEMLDAKKAMYEMCSILEDKYNDIDFLNILFSQAHYDHKSVEQVISAYKAFGYEVQEVEVQPCAK